jgi:hypothetical protein
MYLCVHRASDESSCLLLEDKLRSYSSLVDDRSEDAVNNYAKSSLALASQCKNGKDERVYSRSKDFCVIFTCAWPWTYF